MNSRVKTFSGAKPCVLSGKVASVVAEVGSLFPRVRGSICKNCRQKVHRTVARARFARQNVKELTASGNFTEKLQKKMRKSEQRRICAVEVPLSALREH